ncbi:MAG: hypothetical protein ACI8T1_000171 [Verrucomicrobiales bacterium]|jgi:hypothetical protein
MLGLLLFFVLGLVILMANMEDLAELLAIPGIDLGRNGFLENVRFKPLL